MMAHNPRHSCVFIVRTWAEARGEDLAELRGTVRDMHSGETRYFRTWEDLLAFMERHHATQARRYSPPDT